MRFAALATFALAATSLAEPAARWDSSAVDGAGLPPFRYEVADYVTGLTVGAAVHSEAFTHPDGTRQLLVASTTGPLRVLPIPAPRELEIPAPFFDLREHLAKRYELEPKQTAFRQFSTLLETDLAARPHLYLVYNNRKPAPATNHVVRFEINSFAPFTLGGETEIISWESGGHNGGDLAWGPDGMLYITAGDRSAPGDPNNWGQRTDDIFGSILRIDVRAVDKGYAVPPDNPFVGIENVRPEIWSYGLRNPWRFAFHPDSGELWVGDNGDENWELVHHIKKGANAGWSAFEGNAIFRASNPLSGPTLTHTPAVVQQPHSEMRSVIGGLFYRGDALPELRDHYLYACYFTRRLWAFSYREGQIGTPFQVADSVGQVVAITEDHDREPIITCHSGEILRLAVKSAPPASKPWPAKLSATGLFSDTAELQPATGVYAYQTNAPAWSDGATKKAFVAIASGKPMNAPGGVQLGKGLDVPEGSIVGQTLSIDGKPVETQLLHFDSNWRPFTYRWNKAGTDAELVPEGGLDTEIDGRPRRFMSRAECMSCHTHRSNFTLAFTVAQLDHATGGGTNQIDAFIANNLLVNNAPLKQQRGKPTPDPHDETLPLNLRARSYLDLNCAHCHRETGVGGRAGFQLLAGLPLDETGILDAKPLVGLTGNPEARVLARGQPELSELLTRMSRRGPGQMPLLGTHAVDEKGVALIRDWIRSLRPSEETAN